MHLRVVTAIVFATFVNAKCVSAQQYRLQATVGLGYIERFSIGAGVSRNDRSTLTVTYGSTFFYQPKKFSTYFLAYEHLLSDERGKLRTGFGVKSGFTTFADKYYRWKILSVVPMIVLQKKLTDNISLLAGGGLAVSRIRSVERLDFGDMGKYRRYLPELQLILRYRII
jgi:hypothetical protein